MTTCHGVRDFVASKSKSAKLGWAFILVACIALLSMQLITFYSNIVESKWPTRSYIDKTGVALKFPDIFVCNFNKYVLLCKIVSNHKFQFPRE